MTAIRLPNITAGDPQGQLAQVKSYLNQLAEELNYALAMVDNASGGSYSDQVSKSNTDKKAGTSEQLSNFNQLKSLIIKSADIVNAYYDKISKRLEGVYVAQSDYGTFVQQTTNSIEVNATAITQVYENIQTIFDDLAKLEEQSTSAYIKTGELYTDDNGAPVYGLEIGQQTEINGVEVFNKFARFTANKLSFYDQNGSEVAYISDYKLYISNVEVTVSYTIGNLVDMVLPDGSVVTK